MAQRCPDVFAWMRAVLGPHDLPATTRLVLCAHVPFMDRDGGNCWVGVRRLAITTNLDKGTVAIHRATAIKAGWLIASDHSRHSRCPTVLTAVPNGLGADARIEPSKAAASQLYGRDGQSTRHSRLQLSGIRVATVRSNSADCTADPYIPYLPSLPQGDPQKKCEPSLGDGNRQAIAAAAEAGLVDWILNSDSAKRYAHSPDALERLTPSRWRFQGYEKVIRRITESSKTADRLEADGRKAAMKE